MKMHIEKGIPPTHQNHQNLSFEGFEEQGGCLFQCALRAAQFEIADTGAKR
jgi:hypothetical protein